MLANTGDETEWTAEGVLKLQDGAYRAPAAKRSAEIVVGLTEYVAIGEPKDPATGNKERGAAVILYGSGGAAARSMSCTPWSCASGNPATRPGHNWVRSLRSTKRRGSVKGQGQREGRHGRGK